MLKLTKLESHQDLARSDSSFPISERLLSAAAHIQKRQHTEWERNAIIACTFGQVSRLLLTLSYFSRRAPAFCNGAFTADPAKLENWLPHASFVNPRPVSRNGLRDKDRDGWPGEGPPAGKQDFGLIIVDAHRFGVDDGAAEKSTLVDAKRLRCPFR